jgi:hypothetical protein
MVLGMAWQESKFDPGVVGGRGETGPLQFLPATGETFNAGSTSFGQAVAASRMVRAGLAYNPGWYLLAVPVLGYGYLRELWTEGYGTTVEFAGARSHLATAGFAVFSISRILLLPMFLWPVALLWARTSLGRRQVHGPRERWRARVRRTWRGLVRPKGKKR